MRIGIVGTGIAGLTSAWLARKAGHQVILFEKQDRLGMDAQATEFDWDGKTVRADVPSRMFNAQLWPHVHAMYREIGVEMEPVDASQSFSIFGGPGYLQLDVAYRPQQFLKSVIHSRSRELIREAQRFQKCGNRDLDEGLSETVTLLEYLAERKFGARFKFDFLYPTLSSTVCTCSYQSLDSYPAVIVLRSLQRIAEVDLLRTRFGSQDVVNRLAHGEIEIRLGTTVESIKRTQDSVTLSFSNSDGESGCLPVDHLILSTQANHSAVLPGDLTEYEREVLSAFQYEEVQVIVHSDRKLMPADPRKWSTFNMISNASFDIAMCSVWLNRFHSEWNSEQPVFQTINPLVEPGSDTILRQVRLQRPVVNERSFELWQAIEQMHSEPERRIWFAGSFAEPGIPLLETGVTSSRKIADRLVTARCSLPART